MSTEDAIKDMKAASDLLTTSPDGALPGLPVFIIMEDGTARYPTLYELATTDPDELTEQGWTEENFNQLKNLVTERLGKISVLMEQSGTLRFATVEDKKFALLFREIIAQDLRKDLAEKIKPEYLEEVIDDVFTTRTAEEPATVPKLTMLFGRPIEEFSEGEGDVLSQASDDFDRNWGV